MTSHCICGEARVFKPVITYRNETAFKEHEGSVIARCISCGVLKTIATPSRLKPMTSRVEFYEGNQPIFREYFESVADSIIRFCKSGTVLDVGCASGIMLEILSERGFGVYGLEPNSEAFKKAKQKFPGRVFPRKLKEFSRKMKQMFDIIIYNHVLEHIQDVNREFFLIKKALRPRGLLVVGLPNTDNVIFKLRGKYWESLLPEQHVWHFSTSYIQDILRKQGFEILETSFNNHLRQDYPLVKQLYFKLLTGLNTILRTGEAMLIVARKVN